MNVGPPAASIRFVDGFRITRRDLDEIEATNQEARDLVAGRRSARDVARDVAGKVSSVETVMRLLYTAEVCVGAGAMGVLYGRYGDVLQRSPVPVDATAGVLLHAAAIYYADRWGDGAAHVHAIADGCLASFFTKVGLGYGTELRARLDPPLPPVQIAGREPPPLGAAPPRRFPLTEDELAARVHRFRPDAGRRAA